MVPLSQVVIHRCFRHVLQVHFYSFATAAHPHEIFVQNGPLLLCSSMFVIKSAFGTMMPRTYLRFSVSVLTELQIGRYKSPGT